MDTSPEPVPITFTPVTVTRQKQDPAWKHCQMFKDGERVQLKCLYCGKMTKGGGIRRMKEHLACQKGNGAICGQVPDEVRLLMQESLVQSIGRSRKGKRKAEENAIVSQPPPGEIDGFSNQSIVRSGSPLGPMEMYLNQCSLRKGKRNVEGSGVVSQHPDETDALANQSDAKNGMPFGEIDTFLNQCGLGNGSQLVRVPIAFHDPNMGLLGNHEEVTSDESADRRKRGRDMDACVIGSGNIDCSNALSAKKVGNQVSLAIGKFLYDIGAPLNAVSSVYFQPMVDAIISGGLGFVTPSSQDIRGCILKNLVEEEKKEIDKFRAIWQKTGCSVLVDKWSTEAGRTLLNFLVYCPEGTVFLKSVDASNSVYSTDDLYEQLRQVVDEVGASHVVQVITESEEQYIVAGKRLTDTYPTLYWGSCGAHCIELMLEDFAELEWISEKIEQAKFITRFVYNNSVVLNMVRRYTSGNDIVVPGVTRVITNFTTLKRIVDLKQSLNTMVASQEWLDCPCSKEPGGLAMSDFVNNNNSFWSSCALIIDLTSPLLRVLRMVKSEKKPAMGYVYAGMYRAKETIKKKLMKREDYMVYWNIIDQRWEQQWDHPLHAAGFFLNPKIFYSIEGGVQSKIQSGMFDCIERLVPDTNVQDKIMKEMNLYKNAAGDFGRKLAIRARDTLLPVEWWSTYGGGCPNLSRLAIRILSQTCSSFMCKQNQIPFDKLHATKNCIERQRLSDLVFVQYNMRLKQMVGKNIEQDSLDPISIENMSVVEDWVRKNDAYMEDYGNSDWMALEVPSANTKSLGPSDDEAEDPAIGFDDDEIFSRAKEEAL